MVKLSILIPTIKRDEHFLSVLMDELHRQIQLTGLPTEILIDDHETDVVGIKRDRLLQAATGEYVCHIDSDDKISPNYFQWGQKAIESNCDCASLKGIITTDGQNPLLFEHSMKYTAWKTNPDGEEVKYERNVTPLNLVRTTIAKQIRFSYLSHGEDHLWAKLLQQSGLLESEYHIPDVLYYYLFRTKK